MQAQINYAGSKTSGKQLSSCTCPEILKKNRRKIRVTLQLRGRGEKSSSESTFGN